MEHPFYSVEYLFDHEAFQQEARPLVALADAGDHEPVRRRAREILAQLGNKPWILENQGTGVEHIDMLQGPDLTGFCFLVILSQYLHEIWLPIPMDYLWMGLESLGWTLRDLKRIFFGQRLVTLLKPEWMPDPYGGYPTEVQALLSNWEAVLAPSMYAWCLEPVHTYFTYWAAWPESEEGWRRLKASRAEFMRLDYTKLDVWHTVTFPKEEVPRGYDWFIRLYRRAARARLGFFRLRAV